MRPQTDSQDSEDEEGSDSQDSESEEERESQESESEEDEEKKGKTSEQEEAGGTKSAPQKGVISGMKTWCTEKQKKKIAKAIAKTYEKERIIQHGHE